jgi:hypothetical protein
LQHRACAGFLHPLNPGRTGALALDYHTAPPVIYLFFRDIAIDQYLVGFGMIVTGMREAMCQRAIIGEEHQTLAAQIETANGIQMSLHRD